uniref:NADH-ubiquinone oxidoreductase chain 3 n=1 Tax=Portunion sp. TaxID=2932407 RepID=A0A977TPS2_9CRUS|nr:NADH dehydrogenase subunit 3 [Portunion sp.]
MVALLVGGSVLWAVCGGLFLLSFLTMHRVAEDSEKNSLFECGFEPNMECRAPFSVRFFLIAILFLVFDVEVVLLLPGVWAHGLGWGGWSAGFVVFLLVLAAGAFYEWAAGFLDWKW